MRLTTSYSSKSAISVDLMLLARSMSDSVPTCTMPMSSHLRLLRHTSRDSAVSANDVGSSSWSGPQNCCIIRPTVYLPDTPCSSSSALAEAEWRGV